MSTTVQSRNARLYKIQHNYQSQLSNSTATITTSHTGNTQLSIAHLHINLLPQTVLWFDSPNDTPDKSLNYYFKQQAQQYMLKIIENQQSIHMQVRASGCIRKDRKTIIKNKPNPEGWINSLKQILNLDNPQHQPQNQPQNRQEYIMIHEPTNRLQTQDCPNNSPQQEQNARNERVNMALQMAARVITNPIFRNYISPSPGDHPIVMAGKYILGGAINMYGNMNQGYQQGLNIRR